MSAVRDGDDWVITGQKIWTTLGQVADWCELLVRTDPDGRSTAGSPASSSTSTDPASRSGPSRPSPASTSSTRSSSTAVRVPVDQTLGPVNEGWRVAMTTLAHERGGVAKLHLGLRAKVGRLLETARHTPLGDGRMASDDPVLRTRLARAYLHAELLKLISDRAISGELHGRALGPEGSIAKLQWSETEQLVAEIAGDVLGPDANSGTWGRTASRPAPTPSPAAPPR